MTSTRPGFEPPETPDAPERPRPTPEPRTTGRVAGIASGILGLGIAELIAALLKGPSPLLALGDRVIDLTPRPVKDAVIGAVGGADKQLLLAIVAIVTLALLGLAGTLARKRVAYGVGLLVVLGVIGVAALFGRSNGNVAGSVFGLVVGVMVGIVGLVWLTRTTTPENVAPDGFDRRRFLLAASSMAALGVAGGVGAKVIDGRRHPMAKVTIPRPVSPAAPIPAGTELRIDGLSPYITPVEDFYRVDIALAVPGIDPSTWKLKIHGLVDKPLTLTYRDLIDMPLYERRVTICCVSNPVAGPYIGNTTWTGVRLRDVLAKVGVKQSADAVLSKGADGITIGTPVEALTDGRDALLAVAMDGRPLTPEHGFPVRMVVPGLYGYVSATKWLTDLELTRFDRFSAYWTERGWSAQGPIKTECRIDLPMQDTDHGEVTVAGVAWAQHRGIEKVEVRVDDGEWHQATLGTEDGIDTWRQWRWTWDAHPGHHTIEARAYDRSGTPQTSQVADVAPDGATGYPRVDITVH
ncbi:MAG: molybdopterin-dependent oxidoreductase [Nocardioides sp.]|nr:molybdopterin-dependent oxidoreductase [Nocardioides sp.]